MTTNTIEILNEPCMKMLTVKFFQDGVEVGNAGFDYDEVGWMTNAINCFVTTGNIPY